MSAPANRLKQRNMRGFLSAQEVPLDSFKLILPPKKPRVKDTKPKRRLSVDLLRI